MSQSQRLGDQYTTPIGIEERVNTYVDGAQTRPSIVALEGGGYVVVWQSESAPGDADDEGISAQLYDENGDPAGSEFKINNYTTDSQEAPVVAALDGGGFVVAWHGRTASDSADGIAARMFDAYGAAISSEIDVNANTTSTQWKPTLSGLDDGGFIVVWEDLTSSTGGINAQITARFLHREFFTFRPICKFWLATNHKPRVEDDSHGFWRRVLLIPFEVTFSGPNIDLNLEAKLEAELPSILNWAIEGCLEYQQLGLNPPLTVTEATQKYRAENDIIAAFIENCCVLGEGFSSRAGELYEAFCCFCDVQGYNKSQIMKMAMFGRRMRERFEKGKDRRGAIYRNIGMLDKRYQEPM